MTARWKDLRGDLLDSPEAKAAYERARRDYELGVQIRQLREAAGISQTELARRMGTSQPAVARLEAGGGTPRLDTLERVAAALGAALTVQFVAAPPKLRAVRTAAKPARRAVKATASAVAASRATTARVAKAASRRVAAKSTPVASKAKKATKKSTS